MTKPILAALAVLAAIAGIAVGGWQLGWWLQQSAVNHQSHINRSSYEFQTTLREQMFKKITDVHDIDVQVAAATPDNAAPLRAQRTAIVQQVCDLDLQVHGDIPTYLTQFVQKECVSRDS